jgi:hypothetical protein
LTEHWLQNPDCDDREMSHAEVQLSGEVSRIGRHLNEQKEQDRILRVQERMCSWSGCHSLREKYAGTGMTFQEKMLSYENGARNLSTN